MPTLVVKTPEAAPSFIYVNGGLTSSTDALSCSRGHRDACAGRGTALRHLAENPHGRVRQAPRRGRDAALGGRARGPGHAPRGDPGPAAQARPEGPSAAAGDAALGPRP